MLAKPRDFQRIKEGFVAQLASRLDVIKHGESKLFGPVDGLAIEYQFRRLAAAAGAKNKDIHFGIAGYIEMVFASDQRQALYSLLHTIEEDIPWKGVSLYKVFEQTR
jgi:hypothetical protein